MKHSKSLFPQPPDEFPPSSDRVEPTIWIRRLVIVERREPDIEPIRNVEFRRGLNIICTEQPEPGERGSIGHNVGKTLLTRMIRYCLGEQYFAAEATRKAIAIALPEAYVLAEIIVDGISWVVARPIGASKSTEAWCLQAEKWHSLLGETTHADRFPRFVEVVEGTTVSRFSDFLLPHEDRPLRWIDMLAWYSRDQYCRYRNPVEWRSSHTGSNTADLHFEDASLLIRVTMDLLDNHEKKLVAEHRKLLRQHGIKLKELGKQQGELDRTKEFLIRRLGLKSDLLANDLFGQAAKAEAEEHRNILKKRLNDLANDSELQAFANLLKDAKDAVTRKQQEITTRRGDKQLLEGTIKTHQKASNAEFDASFADLGNPCPLPPPKCPLKDATLKPGERHPVREILIKDRADDLQRINDQLAALQDELPILTLNAQTAEESFNRRDSELKEKREKAEKALVSLDALAEEAGEFAQSLTSVETLNGEVKGLDDQVRESRDAHSDARAQIVKRQNKLNAHFNRVLAWIVGGQPQGRIDIDMKGLHLTLNSKAAVQGEGLTTAEMVLSLDLACLSAGICGLGHCARFFIHDSPREGDLELHIYHRLFEFIAYLETTFEGRDSSFQYIITTTTPPPKALSVKRFVREVLHARDSNGLLLRRNF